MPTPEQTMNRPESVCNQTTQILDHIRHAGGDWSIGELAQALVLDKSTVSARVYELLYDQRALTAAPRRKDRISGVMVRPVILNINNC